jgi:hypothetical protein
LAANVNNTNLPHHTFFINHTSSIPQLRASHHLIERTPQENSTPPQQRTPALTQLKQVGI